MQITTILAFITAMGGLEAVNYDISAIEVIFNMFRLKPAEELFPKASKQNVGIIVRVPWRVDC